MSLELVTRSADGEAAGVLVDAKSRLAGARPSRSRRVLLYSRTVRRRSGLAPGAFGPIGGGVIMPPPPLPPDIPLPGPVDGLLPGDDGSEGTFSEMLPVQPSTPIASNTIPDGPGRRSMGLTS